MYFCLCFFHIGWFVDVLFLQNLTNGLIKRKNIVQLLYHPVNFQKIDTGEKHIQNASEN